MKSTQFSILTVLVIFSLFSLNAFAQNYTQLSLPEGAKARLGKGSISGDIAYSPDGTRLAVASSIGIWLYDTATHQEVALLKGHTDDVISVAFSPDGSALAGGSEDWTVRLWDAVTGQEKATLTGHTGYVSSVAFSPDGGTLASGSKSGHNYPVVDYTRSTGTGKNRRRCQWRWRGQHLGLGVCCLKLW